jgi:hypothetical protein
MPMTRKSFDTMRLAHDWLVANGFTMVSPRLWTTGEMSATITIFEGQDSVVVRFERLK